MNSVTRRNTVHDFWGSAVSSGETGFTPVPDILLRSQAQLQLTPMQLAVLIQILMHWWEPDDWPHPRLSAISTRIGTTPRTVQRAVRALQHKALLVHRDPERVRPGLTVRRFDLSGLIGRLQELAASYRSVRGISPPRSAEPMSADVEGGEVPF